VKGIADTGFLVAFANLRDHHHAWALQVASGIKEPLLTCEAVLAETAFHLQSASTALAMVSAGLVRVAFQCDSHHEALQRLALRYKDQRPDLADLCLVRMSELHPRHAVITVDVQDFRVYRRNGREAIPLVVPPDARRGA
jgi:uncharacterized protein